MLKNVEGRNLTGVPHGAYFQAVVGRLGQVRADEVRSGLSRLVDSLPPDSARGIRIVNSSYLGSELTPWPHPLSHLYDVAREIEGANSDEEAVERQAALMFGLFVWECILEREESWVVYDPNLSAADPNREIIGKTYFEEPD